jgi:hypothetical protein
VAEHALIEDYLVAFRRQMSWRSDTDLLTAELADHLHEATDRLVLAGAEPRTAQRDVLRHFGDPEIVASSFATSPEGGTIMPTPFTRAAGAAALAAAGGWALLGGSMLVVSIGLFADGQLLTSATGDSWASHALWGGTSLTLWIVVPLTLVGAIGMFLRSGARTSHVGVVASGVLASASFVAVTASWTGWNPSWAVQGTVLFMVLMTPALLTFWAMVRLGGAGLGRTWRDWTVLAAWPVALGLGYLLELLGVGPINFTTLSYDAGAMLGYAVGPLLLAAGLAARGRQLVTEQPVHRPERTPQTV